MTRINLLPWREMRRKALDRQVVRGSIFAWVLMVLIVLYAHLHLGGLIDRQQQRNKYLQEEIATLNKQIAEIKNLKAKREALIARMEIIQRLQGDRTQIVHVLDDLVRKLPEGVYLTSLKKSGKEVSLAGVAQSNGRISIFMRKLDSSDWFTNPRLQVINVATERGSRVSKFTLRVTQIDKGKQNKADSVGTG